MKIKVEPNNKKIIIPSSCNAGELLSFLKSINSPEDWTVVEEHPSFYDKDWPYGKPYDITWISETDSVVYEINSPNKAELQ